jgi:hypothetical protein
MVVAGRIATAAEDRIGALARAAMSERLPASQGSPILNPGSLIGVLSTVVLLARADTHTRAGSEQAEVVCGQDGVLQRSDAPAAPP